MKATVPLQMKIADEGLKRRKKIHKEQIKNLKIYVPAYFL